MFSKLREEIATLTGAGRNPVRDKLSRTFFLSFSPSLAELQPWFRSWFAPAGPKAAPLYPWIDSRGGADDFERRVRAAVMAAFDAELAYDLSLAGVSIVDSVNQVVVVADLCDPDTVARMKSGLDAARKAMAEVSSSGSPVYWTGVFVVRRPGLPAAEAHEDGQESHPVAAAPRLESAEKTAVDAVVALARERLDRAFLLDASNAQGMLLTDRDDQLALIGQLLYYLVDMPLAVEDPDEFARWLKRSPAADGVVSGFSAMSFVLPVDSIIEAVAIVRSAEVMRSSLLEERDPDRHRYYLNSFIQDASLVVLDECKSALTTDDAIPLEDPVGHIPDLVEREIGPEDYLATVESIDAALPRVAEENTEAIRRIGEKRVKQWRISLEDHLQAIVGQERGGLLLAERFLDALRDHLETIKPQRIESPRYPDPSTHLRALGALLEKTAPRAAVLGRGAVLAAASGGLASILPATTLGAVGVAGGAVVVAGALSGLAVHSARQRVENRTATLESALHEKWTTLMEHATLEAASERIGELAAVVASAREEVAAARQRAGELVEYFKERYVPPLPEEQACWKHLFRERDELLAFGDRCPAEDQTVAGDYVAQDQPLLLWRRLAPPGTAAPTEWEFRLAEQAALRVLPQCAPLVDLRVLSYLEPGDAKFATYDATLIRGVQPFLNVRPGGTTGDRSAVLESEPADRHPAIEKLLRSLRGQFEIVKAKELGSPYRVSCFAFLENIRPDDLLLR